MKRGAKLLQSIAFIALLLAVVSMFVIAVWILGPVLNWRPVDFCRFYTASGMILGGRSPYGVVPFFAPPWLAFLLLPLLLMPCSSAAVAWILMNTPLAIVTSSLLAQMARVPKRYRLPIGVLGALLPYTVFTYITGQLSIVALASCTLSAWGLSRKHTGPIVAGLILATLKPHIVALPMLLGLLALVRQQHWKPVLITAGVLVILSVGATAFLPAWPRSLLTSWASGGFYEPRENLLGLVTFGVPSWLTYPFVAYALLLWWQRRLDLHTFALGTAVNMLAVPYSRSYDYVLLVIPVAAIWHEPPSPQKRFALGLALLAHLLPLVRVLIPGAGLLEALAPIFCTAGLLLVSRLRWKESLDPP